VYLHPGKDETGRIGLTEKDIINYGKRF